MAAYTEFTTAQGTGVIVRPAPEHLGAGVLLTFRGANTLGGDSFHLAEIFLTLDDMKVLQGALGHDAFNPPRPHSSRCTLDQEHRGDCNVSEFRG